MDEATKSKGLNVEKFFGTLPELPTPEPVENLSFSEKHGHVPLFLLKRREELASRMVAAKTEASEAMRSYAEYAQQANRLSSEVESIDKVLRIIASADWESA